MNTATALVDQKKIAPKVNTDRGTAGEQKQLSLNRLRMKALFKGIYHHLFESILSSIIIGVILVLYRISGLNAWWSDAVGSFLKGMSYGP